MYILGINSGFGGGYQDACAVLLHNGVIVAAVEEERLTRVKFAPGQLPLQAIGFVLRQQKISIQQVIAIAIHGSSWKGDFIERLQLFFIHHFGYCPPVQQVHHHDAHVASAFYASGFEKALIFSFDNSGDGISSQIALGGATGIKLLHREERPNSLGAFYQLITQYCGFNRDADEYKLMGLSAYGNPQAFDLDFALQYSCGSYQLNQNCLTTITPGQPFPTKQQVLYSATFRKQIGIAPRIPGKDINDDIRNLAASAQLQLEEVVKQMVAYWVKQTGVSTVCMAGGVALNCLMNGKLLQMPEVKNLYVPPFAGDTGISVGAAYLVSNELGVKPKPLETCYTGAQFDNDFIEQTLKQCGIAYKECDDVASAAAQLVADGKIIGWFQGAGELGPRALGNRSILANPCMPEMKDLINKAIKFRETFRPFCPSLTLDTATEYFNMKQAESPYMTITFNARPQISEKIPAVIHAGNTARLQTVSEEQNPLFYTYLKQLKKQIGHAVSLNTSFNTRQQPMVNSPSDALETFYSSGLEAMIMGNFILLK